MKVLIVSNGIKFRIKKKTLFGWKFLTYREWLWMGPYSPTYIKFKEFSEFKDALGYLKSEYGTQFKLMNCEVYVPTPITKDLILL